MSFMGEVKQFNLDLHFHLKQWVAFCSIATEILFGGSAGPGKSHLLRLAAIRWATEIKGINIYLFRRVEDDLKKNHVEGPHGFRNLLADMVQAKLVKLLDSEIRFANGSKIFLCHCKDEKHRFKYHGAEIHVLMIDELTTFTELIYRYLRFRVRMTGVNLPNIYRAGHVGPDGKTVNPHDLFPRIICGSNPGNVGHQWVKRTFGLDSTGILEPTRQSDVEGGMVRQYIRALLSDNPNMEIDDPGYRARMRGLGDPMLVRAMELGDWNILAGGFFPEFRLDRHVAKAVSLDPRIFTRRFRVSDWGSARPFSTGWYAIADEDTTLEGVAGNKLYVPRGSLVRYREWYGKSEVPGKDNVGLKLPVGKWAAGILRRTPKNEEILYDVVDPAMFQEHGGPSLAEQAMKVTYGDRKLQCRPADNTRIGKMGAGVGWDQCRMRLRGDDGDAEEDGTPTFFVMDNCPDFIRTVQAVQHDETKPEDIDTDMEDHAVDEWRYACASRPRAAQLPHRKRRRTGQPKYMSFDYLIEQGKGKINKRSIA
jgi:hypothetical protein